MQLKNETFGKIHIEKGSHWSSDKMESKGHLGYRMEREVNMMHKHHFKDSKHFRHEK